MLTSGILFDFRRYFNADKRGNREQFAHIGLFNQPAPLSDWDVLERIVRICAEDASKADSIEMENAINYLTSNITYERISN